MSFYTYAKDTIGQFTERDTGNYFEYSHNDDGMMLAYPHKVWVGGAGVCGMTGYRYARVLKTRVHVVVDEDREGPVQETWHIKKKVDYVTV